MAFYNLWIHFIFREFNFVSMSKIPIPLIQMESWTRCVRGSFYLLAPEEIVYSFLVYFVIVQTWSIYHSLDKKVWLWIMFLPLKESHSVPDMDFFCYTFTFFVRFGVIKNRATKVNSKYFNGNFDHFICPV